MKIATAKKSTFSSGYSEVNGLKMYYEIYGQGNPLILIHCGGSTIQSNFEKVIPSLAKNRQVKAVELQAQGRTSDISKYARATENGLQTSFKRNKWFGNNAR